MLTKSFLFVSLALAAAVQAGAQTEQGLLIVETSQNAAGAEFASTIRLLGDRVRVESDSPDQQQVFIYRADLRTMYLLDPDERVVREISREELEQAVSRISEMVQMMEQQLRDLPAQQRAMMERMMREMMPNMGAAAEPIVYTRVSTGEQVGDWECDRYEGLRGGEKVQEVCATDWSSLDLSADDFTVFQELGEFFEGLSSQLDIDMYPVGLDAESVEEGAFSGVPVSRITFSGGAPATFHEITELDRRSFDASLFEIPEGFTREPSPFEELEQQGLPGFPGQ